MAEPCLVPSASTFVVRFWREWSIVGSRWRGRIEHLQSGESAAFLDLSAMFDFVRCFGAMGDGETQAPPSKE
jgi:hypothetical protein